MAQRVHTQIAALHHLGVFRVAHFIRGNRILATQQGTNAFDQQTLAEGFLDVVIGAHAQAQHFVSLVVF